MRPRARLCQQGQRLRDDQHGQVTAYVVVTAVAALLFGGLALDGGFALAAKVRAVGQAQEAARAGAQEIDLAAYRADGTLRLASNRAVTAAHNHLAASQHSGAVSVTGNTVTVTVTIQQRTQLLGLVAVDTITVTGRGEAQPQRGIS
ncbi:pilus assembly protein TadG-related protein [Lentzea sp. NPDC051838]|uniref:pilus assembly protein TadG-related protein n=1 Tax=Lentzea sp. NPDC051838 TaxID=3154849 RepID=UPI00343AF1B2